jgi:hypothetical protein
VTAACIVTSRPSGHRCPDIGLDRGAMNIATISVEPNDSGEHPLDDLRRYRPPDPIR